MARRFTHTFDTETLSSAGRDSLSLASYVIIARGQARETRGPRGPVQTPAGAPLGSEAQTRFGHARSRTGADGVSGPPLRSWEALSRSFCVQLKYLIPAFSRPTKSTHFCDATQKAALPLNRRRQWGRS